MSVIVGRSKVATNYGIVAASQPLAARAGVQILERGGNAVDAAIAANAVMGLVEPQMNGIGGDLFAMVYEARTGKLHGLNACGWAPTGLTPALLQSQGFDATCRRAASTPSRCRARSRAGRRCATRFGTLPMADAARAGDFLRRARLSGLRRHRRATGRRWPEKLPADAYAAADVSAERPRAGCRRDFRNPRSRGVAAPDRREGPPGFTRARPPTRFSPSRASMGGTMTAADLEDFEPEWVEPISTTYRGWTRLRAAAEHAGHRGADDART